MECGNKISKRVLRLAEVENRTGLPRSTIYARISEGGFPSSVSLGGRTVGWIEEEIDAWIESRIQVSRPSENNNVGA